MCVYVYGGGMPTLKKGTSLKGDVLLRPDVWEGSREKHPENEFTQKRQQRVPNSLDNKELSCSRIGKEACVDGAALEKGTNTIGQITQVS